jgi:hypothetical protein
MCQEAIASPLLLHSVPAVDHARFGDSSNDNALSKLSVYAMSIDRGLFRKMAMLEQLQAARQNEHVTDHPAGALEFTILRNEPNF